MKRILLAALAWCLAGAATAGASATFKDWTAVCDNLRNCTAIGFAGEADEEIAYLVVSRAAAATAPPRAMLAHLHEDGGRAGRWRVALDGKPFAAVAEAAPKSGDNYDRLQLPPAQAAALIAAVRNGSTLTLTEGGKPIGVISLSGAAAALLYIDDQQKRVGTVTALARPGSKPASDVPPSPAAPVVTAGAFVPQSALPRTAPKSVTRALEAVPDCIRDKDSEPDMVARLAPGVLLWGLICDRAAYNVLDAFIVSDETGGGARLVRLPGPPGQEPAFAETAMNVNYDARTRRLTSFSKGRGLGDCGETDEWVWDGKAFRIVRQATMPECRGVSPDDWPTYHTVVVK